jgi:hypothetical protein
MGPGGAGGGLFSWINALYGGIVATVTGLFARAKGVI